MEVDKEVAGENVETATAPARDTDDRAPGGLAGRSMEGVGGVSPPVWLRASGEEGNGRPHSIG
jgi:hypothetical protein